MPTLSQADAKRDELLDWMRRKRVVVITGTGVSMQTVGHPGLGTDVAGWKGLLRSGVKYCQDNHLVGNELPVVDLQIETGTTDSLIDAAEQIHRWMSKRSNARHYWLKQTIGSLRVQDPSLILAIKNLGALIATLNYDGLLTQITGRPHVHWGEQDKVDAHMLNNSLEYILHIHGYWEDETSIVLDRTSYNAISKDPKMQQLMNAFARWQTFLFIGCGGTFFDPNFTALIDWCNKSIKDVKHRHYILCRSQDQPKFLESLQPYGFLEPLVYGNSYEDLIPFLNGLSKDSGEKATASNPAVSDNMRASNIQTPSDIWKLQAGH